MDSPSLYKCIMKIHWLESKVDQLHIKLWVQILRTQPFGSIRIISGEPYENRCARSKHSWSNYSAWCCLTGFRWSHTVLCFGRRSNLRSTQTRKAGCVWPFNLKRSDRLILGRRVMGQCSFERTKWQKDAHHSSSYHQCYPVLNWLGGSLAGPWYRFANNDPRFSDCFGSRYRECKSSDTAPMVSETANSFYHWIKKPRSNGFI